MGKNKPSKPTQSAPAQVRVPGFSSRFKEDLGWWYKTDTAKVDKIFDLVTNVMQPCGGIGKPEPLKYLGEGLWSRRIDLEHRLVYRVSQAQIDFLTCRYHYE
ncbi:Txe/YoeB family addiction module toxin [Gloeocapsa sp. BRSZ]